MTIGRWGFLAAMTIMAAGCGGTAAPPGGGEGAPLFDRTFVSAADDPGRQLAGGTRVRLTFRSGTVSAEAGCNHLSGTLAVEGDRLVVSDLGGTMMACSPELMAQDTWLTEFLRDGPRWTLDAATLVLTTADARLRLVDLRSAEPDRALTGPRWSVESLLDGATAASVPAGTAAHLTFAAGRVTGSTGCAALDAEATAGATTITFSGLPARAPECPPRLRALDAAVRAVLLGEVPYRITGDRLTLTHPGGKGLQLRAGA
ncbi:META domain-containing protein [Pseudosporangium ferrugineum]|uniref:META domain-containing protein n=1 Tax=Pseudosporangium ferrugineum TaxID=439699 RepID=A0A2T0RH93_9ACTN|nr:META domain-containing protein [Pseudosporangium ferrugineum]PRY20543.1 META domain-containing protein [Pseudosporangium ferrugineum]